MKVTAMKNRNEIKYTIIICTVLFFLCFNTSSQWVHLTNVIGSEDTYSLVSNGTKLFAGTYSKGVYYSTNNGTNWVQTSLTNRDVRSLAIIGNYVIAGTRDHGIYYSSNNGTNWSQSNLVTEDVW